MDGAKTISMATKYSITAYKCDKIFVEHLYKYAGYEDQDLPTLLKAVQQGDLAVESILENAIAKVGNLSRTMEDGMDFTDGSDAKKCTAMNQGGHRFYNKGTRISTKNKFGLLRIAVLDPDIEKMFYFKIPFEIYCGNNLIRIPFCAYGGKPYFRSNNYIGKSYWECQVKTFEELCS